MINGQKLCVLVCLALICVISRNSFSQLPANVSPDKPVAVKVFEIGKVSAREFARIWKREDWRFSDWITQLYIINYGTNTEIARRERVIANSISFRNFDRNRITLVRGGPGIGPRTVVWKVPYGADNPEP